MPEMKIGVVVADPDEYTPLAQSLAKYTAPAPFEYFFREGIKFYINGCEIICINCGLGKVNAAAGTMYLIDCGCTHILNYGLSGGVSHVRRGELTVPDRFLEHDFDLSAIGYEPCEKPGQKYIYEADKQLSAIFAEALGGAVSGTAVCGDSFICDADVRDRLYKNFGAVSCDMETAAIASVCDMTATPFCALRRISDDAGESAVDSYRCMNINEGETLCELFVKCLTALCDKTEVK